MRTLAQLRDAVVQDLDLEDDDFISKADLNRWINDGIQAAERKIHTLYEDYFLTDTEVNITYGNHFVDYPSDIYANKVRKIVFKDGPSGSNVQSHEVKRVKDILDAISRDIYNDQTTTPLLQWSPHNSIANGRKIRLHPTNGRTGKLIIYYIRNAKPLVNDSDVCDIDEFEVYVIRYAKTLAYLKDGDPRAEDIKLLEKEIEEEINSTLADAVADNDNQVLLDLSHYNNSNGGDC
jgi:hypothetical protein